MLAVTSLSSTGRIVSSIDKAQEAIRCREREERLDSHGKGVYKTIGHSSVFGFERSYQESTV